MAGKTLTSKQRATTLAPLLDPRSVVIVGASRDFNRTGGIPIENLLASDFARDAVLLVNPKYQEIAGLPCYPSIEDLPFAPDLAILAVRATEVLPALKQCAARGIQAATIFASGFAEENSPQTRLMQEEISEFAQAAGLVISGPNCLGHVNFRSGFYATFLKWPSQPTQAGGMAVVAQSGNMASVLWRAGREAGLGFSYLVNTGNEAGTGLAQYLEHFCDDPNTTGVVAYIEQLRDGPRFLRVAARMHELGKPLFVLKAGTSEKGAQAAASHTAAMAGSSAAYATAFAQVGAVSANDPVRLMDLARLWRSPALPTGKRVCIVSVSGAGCALLADQFARQNIDVPTLGAATQQALKGVVPSYGMVSNPVDLTGQVTNDTSFFSTVLDAIAADPDVDAIVFYVMGYLLDLMAPELLRVAPKSGKQCVVIDTGYGAKSHAELESAGIAVFQDMDRAVHAVAARLHWACVRGTSHWRPADSTQPSAPAIEIAQARAEGRLLLTEVQAKAMLGRAGLPMVQEELVRDANEAATAAQRLGFPVAVKVVSAQIAHKTDVGGVVLNVSDVESVRQAFAQVTGNARLACPDAEIQGAVVQPMAGDGQAVLLGIVRDSVFGPIMTVGLGGVLTELYQDVSRRVLPIDANAAEAMLRELRSFPLLEGYRGSPRADRTALVALMTALSTFMVASGHEIDELELNPVLVRPASPEQSLAPGAIAVDALVRLSEINASSAI